MEPTARYTSKIVKQKVEESLKDQVLTLRSPPPLGSDSPSDEARKRCKNTKSKKELSRRKSSVLSSDKETLSLKESMKEVTKSPESTTTNSDAEDWGPSLKVPHVTDSHFQNVVSYKTYCPLDT